MPDPKDYHWVDDALAEAACVTAVAGTTVHDVLAAFGADVSTTLTGDQVYGGDVDNFPSSVSVREVPGGVIAVELNGYQGTLPEVLARLSLLGPAASIFWNVNDDNAFSCAREGEVIATVDMYDAEDPDDVDLPLDLMALFVSAADGTVPSLWAVGLAMVVTFTGVSIPEDAVRSAAPFHPVPGA